LLALEIDGVGLTGAEPEKGKNSKKEGKKLERKKRREEESRRT
jgi:hypothetical protein